MAFAASNNFWNGLSHLMSSATAFGRVSVRHLTCNRAVVTKIRRATYVRKYPTLCVLPDGATININYQVPRKIVKLPIDLSTASEEIQRQVRTLRRPREKVKVAQNYGKAFDPMKYISKK